jgi:membrane protein YdbS with pleckstrin-like domain
MSWPRALFTPISSLLEEGESVFYRTGQHPASILPFAAIALLLSIPTYGISLILLIPPIIHIKACCYVVTNRRILARDGILGQNMVGVPLCDIFEASAGESCVSARFGMGRVELRDGSQTIRFKGIKSPRAFIYSVMKARAGGSA